MDIETPIAQVSPNLKTYAGKLKKLGIITLEDLLYHIPFRFENYQLFSKIALLQPGETVTVQGIVVSIKNEYTRNFKRLQIASIADETGSIKIIWFNQPYLVKYIHVNDKISISGKVDLWDREKAFISPEFEIVRGKTPMIHTGRLVPIYPETKGVSSKWLRRQIHSILQTVNIKDFLPEEIKRKYQLIDLKHALYHAHFPDDLKQAEIARRRLAFDELLLIQLQAMLRKNEWQKQTTGSSFQIEPYRKEIQKFWSNLPFTLTNAQKKAVSDIFSDMHKTTPMNRLLQGDVGSGKTVVATIAMYLAYLNGYQSVLMAPTEILANQHYQTVSSLLTPFGVKVGLVTGTKKLDHKTSGSKNNINNVLNSQSSQVAQAEVVTTDLITDLDILIGTHALLYNKKRLRNLGLVVIDEQHRFGVNQRSLLRQKGKNPHVLTMTATPIPRTVALTMYKDLNLSYLDEMPKGRKIIKTWLVPLEKRGKAYEWIRKQVQQTNSQAFIICPFIEISETMQTVKAATAEYERLKKEIFPDLRIGLLHGKMKSKDKNAVLQDFKKGKYHILVATPVVEVGIDIPNATIIVIEASERFGLAQLHQLRGRVGRGEKQSFCLLFTESKNEQTLAKLKELERIHIGAELAELDLRLRGPGEIYGTLQSGIPNLKIASFSDVILIEQTRKAAEMILSNPAKYPYLLHKLRNTTEPVSPD